MAEAILAQNRRADPIPPPLPLQKGVPRFAGFGNEGAGEILGEYVWSIMHSLIINEGRGNFVSALTGEQSLCCSSKKFAANFRGGGEDEQSKELI
jgi:hypothetical protein